MKVIVASAAYIEAVPGAIPSVKTAKDDKPVSRALYAMNQNRMPSKTYNPLLSGLSKTSLKLSRTLHLSSLPSGSICWGSFTKINTTIRAIAVAIAPAINGATRPNELNR
jgi:hypothetical protein